MNTATKLVAAFLAALLWTGSGLAGGGFEPGVPHYFDTFDPAAKPWNPGQELNIEDVFKNYRYYEVFFDGSGREITVHTYIQNRKTESAGYRILPDGSLERKP